MTDQQKIEEEEEKIEEEEEKKEEDDGEEAVAENIKKHNSAAVTLTPLKFKGEIAENNSSSHTEDAAEEEAAAGDGSGDKPIKLYRSSRLKGYITLVLASFINYQSAQDSADVQQSNLTVVPSTGAQRRYAIAVAVVSLVLSLFCLLTHLDRITPLVKVWIVMFKDGSKIEGIMLVFWSIWWIAGTGVETAVSGIAGDGKGQYSLYYSTWVCCLTTLWCLERWWIAMGWPSLKSFISSWPNRSPAWICIMVLSLLTLIWYVDLWQNHKKLDRRSERFIYVHFKTVGEGQWQWLIIVTVFTFCPAVVFVLVELFRETKADGSNADKSNTEIVAEGICFLVLAVAWIPTVMIATTPRGAASLIGNSYFFTWLLTIFVFEGLIWFIHDKRKETHRALKEKEAEYKRQQLKVLEKTREIQEKNEERERAALEGTGMMDKREQPSGTEYFVAGDSLVGQGRART